MKCWICKRTPKEVWEDYEPIYQKHQKPLEDPGTIAEIIGGYESSDDLDHLVSLQNFLGSPMPICAICDIMITDMSVTAFVEDMDSSGQTHEEVKKTMIIELQDIFAKIRKELK